MRPTKKQLKKIEKFAESSAEKPGKAHDIDHITKVRKFAEIIAKREKADLDIIKVAAMLHDCSIKKKGVKNHEKESAKMAIKFLKDLKLDKDFINKVVHAIECHGSRLVKNAKTLEAKIIHDADKFQTVGVGGFCRLLHHFSAEKKLDLKDAVDEIRDVQKRHYNILQTKTAKKFIKDSYQLMQKFYRLYDKWDKVKTI